MILYNQKEIIEALSNPKLYPTKWHVEEVTIRQSHIAILFLAGEYAFKLKRAVLLPNIDFSTPAKRRLACVQEMKRSTIYAPHLVLGIRSVRRLPNGRICIGGKAGEEVDTILVMKRIPDNAILGQILPSPYFDRFEVMDLAEQLAELHMKAKTFRTKWGMEDIQKTILETERVLSCFCPDVFDKHKLNTLMRTSLENLAKNARLITLRQKSGHIRKCHGDLLLCNIAYEEGKFLFFSPIEYSDTLDCIDTLYDLAFLMMDFEARGMRRLTNMFFNHYMAYMNDIGGYPLLPLYQSMRAATRAAVCVKKSTMLEGEEKQQAIQNAKDYFDLAYHFMSSSQPVLIACGGLSGSGKSRIAREIGGLMNPAPGAVILRDDVVKKQINGCGVNEHFDRVFDTPIVEKVVYDVLRQQARTALKSGSCVIVDALFYNEKERVAIEELAKEMNVPFIGLWMDAPLSVRVDRIHARKRNPSNVTKRSELEQQLSLETGDIQWNQVSTDKTREETVESVIKLLSQISPVPLFMKKDKNSSQTVCCCPQST